MLLRAQGLMTRKKRGLENQAQKVAEWNVSEDGLWRVTKTIVSAGGPRWLKDRMLNE